MPQEKEKEKVILEGAVRVPRGKQGLTALRQEGWVPGVVYAEGEPALAVQVGAKDLAHVLHTKAGGNVLITLRVQGDSKKPSENPVLIKEMQQHPVSHRILHVDFHRVSLTKRITVTVPVSVKGEAVGVKQGGGILEHIRWDLEVECLPTQIPSEIPVDVSRLELNQTLTAKAVTLPEGVRLVTDGEQPIVACVVPRKEEVPAAAEAAAAAPEPEVLKQKKPEEIAAEEEQKAKEKEKEKQEKKG